MDKMTGKEKRDWTFMSENPPTDEWGEARMQRLLDLGAGSAKWYGAGDQVDNVVQNVILRMIKIILGGMTRRIKSEILRPSRGTCTHRFGTRLVPFTRVTSVSARIVSSSQHYSPAKGMRVP